MPCRDGRDECWGSDGSREVTRLQGQLDGMQARLDSVSALLCEAMRRLKNPSQNGPLSKELTRWWAEHEVFDKGRLRKEGLAKLTEEEKIALGLKSGGSAPFTGLSVLDDPR